MAEIDWVTPAMKLVEQRRESGQMTPTQYYQSQLNLMGRRAYMDAYPEVFTGSPSLPVTSRIGWEEQQRINELYGLLGQFHGPESGFIRWMIRNKIKGLEYELDKMRGVTEARPPTYAPPPIPDWMQEYIVPGETIERGAPSRAKWGERTKQTYKLKPLSAQEELTPEQMGQMAAYQAWQKAGAPTEYSDWALRAMSDWQRHWDYYTRQSESLFPQKTKQTTRWKVATQR